MPHLSTEVLKAAADNTAVQPEGVLFEVLTANPDELRKEEYDAVVDAFYDLGLRNGYFQEMDSFENYRPDFDKGHPFEG